MASRTIEYILAANSIDALREQEERVSRQIQPTLERLDALLLDIGQWISPMIRKIVNAVRRTAQWISPVIRKVADVARRTVAFITRPISQFVHWINQHAEKVSRWISEWWEGLKRDLPRGLKAMAARDWFMDDEMPLDLITSFESRVENAPQAVEDELSEYYRERVDRIEEAICEAHPHRRPFLQAAFRAHRRGEYELSVPVLFAQADGIWEDECGRSLFSNRGPKSAAADYQDQRELGLLDELLLSPLSIRAPLWLSKGEREQSFDGLNRNQVMHGESVDYNTEINSLKALSFLSYINTLLQPSVAT